MTEAEQQQNEGGKQLRIIELSSGEPVPLKFPTEDDSLEAYVFKAVRDGEYEEKTDVYASYLDVASNAEDIDSAEVVRKCNVIATIEPKKKEVEEIEFRCVGQSETSFRVEGPGKVSIMVYFREVSDYEEEDEEEEEEEKKE